MIRRILSSSILQRISAQKSVKFHTSTTREQRKKEFTEKVHPFSQINVNLKGVQLVKILPFDLLDCADANILRATATSDEDKEPHVSIDIQDKDVNVESHPGVSEVLLEIPVKADLSVAADGKLDVADLHSDRISVSTSSGISTRNLRSESIELHSKGDIVCRGLTLGYKVRIETEDAGNVSLEKVQGEELQVDCKAGSISTESCYSTNSKFSTQTGNLVLNNVHRCAEVNVLEEGNLTMCGFNGTLLAKVCKGRIQLQLAELWGENVVISNAAEDVSVNVADAVVDTTYFHAAAENVHVDDSLKHLLGTKENGAVTIGKKTLPQKLFIQTEGRLEIKKLSWVDAVKLKM
ncbi:uncharacterized protein LOC129791939 [Lutzomyia longipalpis]|nr:uncharacterized protein LOC129791939 [Lutzomyia longipalpis]